MFMRLLTIAGSLFASSLLGLAASTPASAQIEGSKPDGIFSMPRVNDAIWDSVITQDEIKFVHRLSGAVCHAQRGDLVLAKTIDFAPDGSDSGCEYNKTDATGLSRMTLYFYTDPTLSGPQEYRSAKAAIVQNASISAVEVTEDKDEAQKCYQATVPTLAGAILEKRKADGAPSGDSQFAMGLALYDIKVPSINGRPAMGQSSLLSVYQTGDWIIKTRVTLPRDSKSYTEACRYSAFANLYMARTVSSVES
jgi:hypothetical protein